MAKWDAGVADFSISGKGVKDTYDDGDEREVIIDELNNVLLPQYTAYPNPQLHPMDVRVVDENGIIQYWAEIECGKEEHIDYRKHAGSILGRKRKSVLEHYKIAPVLMFFLNNSKTRYFLYYFNPKHIEKYPLELINYRPETITRLIEQRRKEGRSFPESPFDYKHKVPSRHGEFRNIGEYL